MKRFSVRQSLSAMKVGTDGTLLGALGGDLALRQKAARILDIGTGTGLIALMAAQKTDPLHAHIVGIETDHASFEEARDNVLASPFRDRIEVIEGDFLHYLAEKPFDLILSNPPYFTATHGSEDERRTLARHFGRLTPFSLLLKSSEMLGDDGRVMMIFPTNILGDFSAAAERAGLRILSQTMIHTTPRKSPKRVVATFGHKGDSSHLERLSSEDGACSLPSEETLTILDELGAYTPGYRALLSPFLTIF